MAYIYNKGTKKSCKPLVSICTVIIPFFKFVITALHYFLDSMTWKVQLAVVLSM